MKIRIGTRGSALAQTQTSFVADALSRLAGVDSVKTVIITTTGDRNQEIGSGRVQDKREWVHELELALLQGEIDIALHSGKDIPAVVSPDTVLRSVLVRASPYDVFVGRRTGQEHSRLPFAAVPQGASLGTASLRRRAQLLRARPDLQVIEHRGNVPTRLSKLDESGSLSGIILAQAGLERLGYRDIATELLRPPLFIPAVNQGILVAQVLESSSHLRELISAISDQSTEEAFRAERACVTELPADCHSALGIFCEALPERTGVLRLHARVLTPDGGEVIEVIDDMKRDCCKLLGQRVGAELLRRGAVELLQKGGQQYHISSSG